MITWNQIYVYFTIQMNQSQNLFGISTQYCTWTITVVNINWVLQLKFARSIAWLFYSRTFLDILLKIVKFLTFLIISQGLQWVYNLIITRVHLVGIRCTIFTRNSCLHVYFQQTANIKQIETHCIIHWNTFYHDVSRSQAFEISNVLIHLLMMSMMDDLIMVAENSQQLAHSNTTVAWVKANVALINRQTTN